MRRRTNPVEIAAEMCCDMVHMHSPLYPVVFRIAIGLAAVSGTLTAADRVKTANGAIETTAPPSSGVRSFKGIPFGQPPVGALRWREPQPVKNWSGVRNHTAKLNMQAMKVGEHAFFYHSNEGKEIVGIVEVSKAFALAHELGMATVLWC